MLEVLRASPVADTATAIITGIGRSGTSMVAAVASALGVNMGQSWAQALYEDEHFNWAITYHHHELRRQLSAERDVAYAHWGFKFPGLHNALQPPELEQFRSPRLVICVRDAVAVTQSICKYEREPKVFLDVLDHVQLEQSLMLRFAKLAEVATILVSYEKCLAKPATFVLGLAAFLGLKPSEDTLQKAVLMVDPENTAYQAVFNRS